MDPLREDDIEQARTTSPSVKAAQTLAAMRFGFKLKWANLRQQHPGETEAELDERFLRWLARDD